MARLEIDIAISNLSQSVSGLKSLESVMNQTVGTLDQNIRQNAQYSRSLRDISAQIKAGKGDFIELTKQQENLRSSIQSNKTAIRNQINELNSAGGSLVEMRSSLNLATKAFDQLTKSERENANIGGALATKIQALHKEVSTAEQATNRFQRQVGNYEKGQANANQVALEFTRIIQDAPYGMQGVGNNLQQLSTNWGHYVNASKAAAQANGTAVTSMSLIKGALSSLISPANLLTLGISAITAGWTAYTMWQQKANKASKETKNELQQLRDSLNDLDASMVSANAKGREEEERLNRLTNIYRDNRQSQVTRKNAYDDIISIYESYFGKLSEEEKRTFNLSANYDKLTNSILQTAKARGYEDAIRKNIDNIVLLENQIEKSNNAVNKYANTLNKIESTTTGADFTSTMGQGANMNVVNNVLKATANLNNSLEENKNLVDQRNKLNYQNWQYEQKIYDLGLQGAKISEGRTESTRSTTKSLKEAFDYLSKIRDLVGDRQKDIDLINLDGQAKDLKDLEYKWQDYFNTIKDLQNKLNKDISSKNISPSNAGTVQTALNNATSLGNTLQTSEQNEILKKYASEREEIIDAMNQKVGLLEANSREKDLKKFQDYLDKQIKMLISHGANINEIQSQIDQISATGRYNINTEWDSKQLEEWGKQNDRLQAIIDRPFTTRNRNSLTNEFQKRSTELKNAYNKLVSMTGGTFDQNELDRLQGELNVKLNASVGKVDLKSFTDSFNNSFSTFFSDLTSNITEFGNTFSGILSSVAYSFGSTLNSILTNVSQQTQSNFFSNLLKANEEGVVSVKENWQSMSKEFKQGMGLQMAGNLVSSITGQNSVVGQGLGGALTGAGTGLAIAGPLGALIGGGVGLLGGILGASKRRKQERLQQQQLAEQKKANALLERQNALMYTSNIIGGKTNYGIVSSVDRSATGEITLKVNGTDLVAVVNKTTLLNNR